MFRSAFILVAVLAATCPSALAFDCGKAKTATEKAICSNDALKKLDDDLQGAWNDLAGKLGAGELKSLRTSQRAWLKQRDERCGYGSETEKVDCLTRMIGERYALLAGTPGSGPGPSSPMEPFFIIKEGSKRTYSIDITGLRFTEPKSKGEVAFNEAIEALINEAPVNEEVDFDPPGLEYQQSMQITYAGPALISALLPVYRYDGGAHPNHYTTSINVSSSDGVLSFADVFDPGKTAALAQLCYETLGRPGGDRLSKADKQDQLFENTPKSLETAVGDLSFWTFDTGGATVHFAPYAIAAYVMGDFECRLPMAVLRELAKNTSYLPQ